MNQALEPAVRTVAMAGLVVGGYAVSGAVASLVVSLAVCFAVGLYSIRGPGDLSVSDRPFRFGVGFSLTAATGIIGVQLLFNQDVVWAEHYLGPHDGGIYGGLNKIATIIYFLTLSVSQVLFPRVVDAVARKQEVGPIFLSSILIVAAVGFGVLVIFAAAPGLVVGTLYGPGFRDAIPYVFWVGVIGLALSLNNLLVQFSMAGHDRTFMLTLSAACLAEAALLITFHDGVGQVIADVLVTQVVLLIALGLRCYVIVVGLSANQRA
jgi:O-antigen/teichoic acid export membrane protein